MRTIFIMFSGLLIIGTAFISADKPTDPQIFQLSGAKISSDGRAKQASLDCRKSGSATISFFEPEHTSADSGSAIYLLLATPSGPLVGIYKGLRSTTGSGATYIRFEGEAAAAICKYLPDDGLLRAI